jgi:hypothetical protein
MVVPMDYEPNLSSCHFPSVQLLEQPVAQDRERLRAFIGERNELALPSVAVASGSISADRFLVRFRIGNPRRPTSGGTPRVADLGQRRAPVEVSLAPPVHERLQLVGAPRIRASKVFVVAGGAHDYRLAATVSPDRSGISGSGCAYIRYFRCSNRVTGTGARLTELIRSLEAGGSVAADPATG